MSLKDTADRPALLPRSAKLLPASRGPALDWDAAARYLRSCGVEFDTTFAPRRFATGHANLNYLVRCNGDWAVLRRPPVGPLPPGAHDMVREHRVLSRLHECFALAPRSLAVCQDPQALGAPFLLVQYRDGIVISGARPQLVALDADRCARLSHQLVSLLVDLHRVDPAAVGLDTLGRPDGFLERAVKGWGERAARIWAGEDVPELGAVLDWLASGIPKPQRACLLHCDFKLDNLIVDPQTFEPVALVDWDMATRGDPLFDVATLLSYWTEAGDPPVMHDLDQMPTAHPGFARREDVLLAYADATGVSTAGFRFYRVLCLLKLAVVFAQLHARWQPDDPATEKYRRFKALSHQLLRHCDAVRRGQAH